MWFNNAYLYQFIDKANYQAETLDSALENLVFTPCSKHAASSVGWEPPLLVRGAPLVHAANGFLLMCLRTEEKVIPSGVLKQLLDEKIEEISTLEQRRVSRKEKQNLKEDIYQSLLPQAFCQSSRLYGYIDTVDGWIVINTSSAKKAELFTTMLRKALGSLKIQLPQVHAPSVVMSKALSSQQPLDEFEFLDYCVLKDTNENQGTIRCQHQDLLSNDIQACLAENRFVSELAFAWQQQVSFVINQDFSLRKIKFLDVIKEQAKESYADSYQQQFDTNFVLMSQSLRHVLRLMMRVFANHNAATLPEPQTMAS